MSTVTNDRQPAGDRDRPEAQRLVQTWGPSAAERDPGRSQRRRRNIDLVLAVGVPAALLGLWELAARVDWIDARLYPAPTTIVEGGWALATDGRLLDDIWLTVRRVLIGYTIGLILGVVVGILMGTSRMIRSALQSVLDALYVVPKLALLPIFLSMLGFGEAPKIALVVTTVFFFVWISTMAAIMSVPVGYREAASTFGATRWQQFTNVIFPGALPQIFIGARVASGVAVLVIVAAEFIAGGGDGVGYLIFNSRALFQNKQMFVGIVVIAVLGVAFATAIRWLGRLATPWAPPDESAPML
jgi:sulfonate transport system permease protein